MLKYGHFPREASIIEFQGRKFDYLSFPSPAAMFAALREGKGLPENAQDLWELFGRADSGLGGQSCQEFLTSRLARHALTDFNKASAKLHAAPVLGSRQSPAVCGGAWVIPSVLANHPMPARVRTRDKLPPKILKIRLGTNSGTPGDAMADPAARIARAVWDYQLAGGVTRVSLWFGSNYPKTSFRGTAGLRVDCQIPLSDTAAFATAISVPFYRLVYLTFGRAGCQSSGLDSLSLPSPADVLWIKGHAVNDKAQLVKAGIQ